ncbi:hypothetical protein [Vibrio tapetis]|uniref:Uncharacterized protein n=1 Tax=Vibrio tapetis subsp. tapetis TaxID=1671868 RepID=A0A2N8ZKX8_9VIBR|nr:hypothetical protein [Vibrio tapetis]SON52544.1 exported protein of unknown function [Vibrio tapetis subsp. tapetis]
MNIIKSISTTIVVILSITLSTPIHAKSQNFDKCGYIEQVRSTSNALFINLDGKYPVQRLTGVMFKFSASDAYCMKQYIGDYACFTGDITYYKGKPQIVINDIDQIEIPH